MFCFRSQNICGLVILQIFLYSVQHSETNYVKLIGKAWDNSKMLNDGSLSCKVVQRCINDVGTPFS